MYTHTFCFIAKLHGIQGSILVLESDGTRICDDETLDYYAQEKQIFMILEESQQWAASGNISITSLIDTMNQPGGISIFENDTATTEQYTPSNVSLDTTLSMTSTALSTSSSCNEQGEKLFENFQIPWHKMPPDILTILENNQILGKRLNTLANIIVDELRKYTFYIPMSVIRSISQKVANKYPHSFIEKDSTGNILHTQPIALITTIKNRNNFLNRAPKRVTSSVESNIPLKQRRLTETLKKTCPNWQPADNMSRENNKENIDDEKMVLQNKFLKTNFTKEDEATISKLMENCFANQRLFFNNRDRIPTVSDIKENWPFIFRRRYLYEHFDKLMNLQAESFVKSFEENKAKCIAFLKANNILKNDCPQNDEILEAFGNFFKEQPSVLFRIFEVCSYNLILMFTSYYISLWS